MSRDKLGKSSILIIYYSSEDKRDLSTHEIVERYTKKLWERISRHINTCQDRSRVKCISRGSPDTACPNVFFLKQIHKKKNTSSLNARYHLSTPFLSTV